MRDFGNRSQKSKYIVLTYDLILPLLVISLILGGVYVAFKSKLLSVKVIRCQLDYQDCPAGPVMAELGKCLGSNLIELNTETIAARLQSGDFTIRQAEIKKNFPHTLIVSLQSVYPVVAVKQVGVDNEWLVLDQKYRIIGLRTTDPNVPAVIVPSAPAVHVGQQITDSALVRAFDLSLAIKSELPQVKSLSLDGETLTLKLSNGQTALMSTAKDEKLQIRTLQAILQANTMSLEEARIIDVRFSKPVLR